MIRYRRTISLGFLSIISIICLGCQPAEETPRIVGSVSRLEAPAVSPTAVAPLAPSRLVAGKSRLARPITYEVLGQGSDVAMIIASIHGNEPAGTPLVRQLKFYLQKNPQILRGKMVVIVPIANPDGYEARKRGNVRGVDLNRNFPTSNRINNGLNGPRGLSEPESKALYDLVRKYRPQRIVSIHQPYACIDYDGPGAGLARAMARHCDLPIKKLGALPGSMGSWVGETLGRPIITMELPADAHKQSPATLWKKYGRALLAAISYPENLP